MTDFYKLTANGFTHLQHLYKGSLIRFIKKVLYTWLCKKNFALALNKSEYELMITKKNIRQNHSGTFRRGSGSVGPALRVWFCWVPNSGELFLNLKN